MQHVEAKNKLTTAENQIADDRETAAALKKDWADKKGEFEARQKDGAAEQEAINAAIGVLNNDDALQLMNKAPGAQKKEEAFPQYSLLQTAVRKNSGRAAVLRALRVLHGGSSGNGAVALLEGAARAALKSGKPDFGKVCYVGFGRGLLSTGAITSYIHRSDRY